MASVGGICTMQPAELPAGEFGIVKFMADMRSYMEEQRKQNAELRQHIQCLEGAIKQVVCELRVVSQKIDARTCTTEEKPLLHEVKKDLDRAVCTLAPKPIDSWSAGTGHTGIIPSSFFGDLDIATAALNNEFPKATEESVAAPCRSPQPHVARSTLDDGFTEAQLRKRKSKIQSSVPGPKTSNPIAAITNFCRHQLRFDVFFDIKEEQTDDPSEPNYVVNVYFPGQVVVGTFLHARKKYAKE